MPALSMLPLKKLIESIQLFTYAAACGFGTRYAVFVFAGSPPISRLLRASPNVASTASPKIT